MIVACMAVVHDKTVSGPAQFPSSDIRHFSELWASALVYKVFLQSMTATILDLMRCVIDELQPTVELKTVSLMEFAVHWW